MFIEALSVSIFISLLIGKLFNIFDFKKNPLDILGVISFTCVFMVCIYTFSGYTYSARGNMMGELSLYWIMCVIMWMLSPIMKKQGKAYRDSVNSGLIKEDYTEVPISKSDWMVFFLILIAFLIPVVIVRWNLRM